jgi:AraC-like DNA-binding protein
MSLKGQVSLKKELNGDRVKNYSAKMAAGLTYNYAAKQVNDQILGVMQNLADEMELTGKFAELYNGATINTGENRKVLHHLLRGQLGNDIEYDGKNAGWSTALQGYAQVLFTMLLRRLKDRGESSDTAVTRIEEYVSEHLFDKITLSDIAANCFYNPSYFSRKFKSYFGKNLTDYLKEKRLFSAAKMLRDTSKTSAEIAEACGFSDKTQFYKLFRTEFGCTPSEYRKK